MEEKEEFTSLKSIIKRDLSKQNISKEIFQIQSEKGSNKINLKYLGKYNSNPIENITSFTHGRYNCDLISFTMERDEICLQNKDNQSLLLIGYLIDLDDKIIGALEYVFKPNKFIQLKKHKCDANNIEGKFEIKLTTKKNNKQKTQILKEIDFFSGREETIYILTTLLIEENVIKRIEEEYK